MPTSTCTAMARVGKCSTATRRHPAGGVSHRIVGPSIDSRAPDLEVQIPPMLRLLASARNCRVPNPTVNCSAVQCNLCQSSCTWPLLRASSHPPPGWHRLPQLLLRTQCHPLQLGTRGPSSSARSRCRAEGVVHTNQLPVRNCAAYCSFVRGKLEKGAWPLCECPASCLEPPPPPPTPIPHPIHHRPAQPAPRFQYSLIQPVEPPQLACPPCSRVRTGDRLPDLLPTTPNTLPTLASHLTQDITFRYALSPNPMSPKVPRLPRLLARAVESNAAAAGCVDPLRAVAPALTCLRCVGGGQVRRRQRSPNGVAIRGRWRASTRWTGL